MQLSVKGRQIDVGDALRTHAEETLSSAVDKYFSNPIDASVVFSKDGGWFRAELSVHVGRGIDLQAGGRSESAYHAFDEACERLAKRLRRYKRRLRDHHRDLNGREAPQWQPAQHYILAADPPPPEDDLDTGEADDDIAAAAPDSAGDGATGDAVVVAEMTTRIPRLTPSDAAMHMDLADLPVLMFENAAHGRLNVVYRRQDGNIGWIDPQETGAG